MTDIALIGATGNIGSRVLTEALSRGHAVTALTRDASKMKPRAGMTVRQGSTTDAANLAAILAGHAAIIVSVKWNEANIRDVLDAVRRSGVKRALFVVGAGSLLRSDGRTHLDHMADRGVQPPTSKPASLALAELRKVTDLDWTAISPAASIRAGERTGEFRLGGDDLLEDEEGQSQISYEDFAIAIVDEIEKPRHLRRRFTAAY
ncbi:MAG: NAD(P)H-binding protein [Alphaproteobacteria bacterium]|jgi:putative NADH-flavin reductase|nr:NAD(P)H-binding protein [Alphaproteobacteria bacterium]